MDSLLSAGKSDWSYLDGELPQGTRAEIDAHLADCASCRVEVEARRTFITRLKGGASYFEAPPALVARLAQSLSAKSDDAVSERAPRRGRESLWRPLALAASFLLAVLLSGGVGYMSSLPPHRRSHHPGSSG